MIISCRYVIPSAIVLAVSLLVPNARADDHGCQVLLCLANPGGATQYAQCVPPITKLYEDLAKGKPFPTCTGGGGMETTSPVSDPYYCKGGFVLDFHQSASYCRSPARTVTVACPLENEDAAPTPPFGGPQKVIEGGREICKNFEFSDVQFHDKKSYIDVTVSATGKKTRVRF